MPGGDRTGPLGAGPRSGRGMGFCSGYNQPGFANQTPIYRGSFSFGNRGAGRGWRHRFFATDVSGWVQPAPDQETADLKAQADLLKAQLDVIQKRIEELASK